MQLAYIPSPSQGVWHLGPIPIRAYALFIILGIVVAVWVGERRWVARGGRSGTVMDVAVWAVVFGLIGGRLYHVLSDPELYFGAGRHPLDALKVWNGGLGIWGAISLGGVGAWIGCHRAGIKLPPYADAVAPGIALAQAIGRWGNYFNQELFGKPTTLPWGLKIDPGREGTVPGAQAYHPTFLYESLWDLGIAGLVVWADRRFTLGRGRAFALYVMAYTAGRFWIEALRIDHANKILGLRLNIWTSALVFAGALAYFILHRGPRETDVQPEAGQPEAGQPAGEAAAAESNAGDELSTGAGKAGEPTEAEARREPIETDGAESGEQVATGGAGRSAEPAPSVAGARSTASPGSAAAEAKATGRPGGDGSATAATAAPEEAADHPSDVPSDRDG